MCRQGLVSLIVPAYNAAETLSKCLDSIIKQQYADWEVILINDGSVDDTAVIADAYAKRDCRIKIIHKENAGVSSARNEGLKLASGQWLSFVDADDYIDELFLLNMLEYNDSDFVIGGYRTIGRGEIKDRNYTTQKLSNKDEIAIWLNSHLTDMPLLCPWGKLFRNSLVREQNMIFNTRLRVGEDTDFVWKYITFCDNIQIVEGQYYCYFTEKSNFKYMLDVSDVFSILDCLSPHLNEMQSRFNVKVDDASFFIYNYYIWLYKLYVRKRYHIYDIFRLKSFFNDSRIRLFFDVNKHRSYDKWLINILIRCRLWGIIQLIIKLRY